LCNTDVIIEHIDNIWLLDDKVHEILVQNKHKGRKKLLKMLSVKDGPLEVQRILSVKFMPQVLLLTILVAIVHKLRAPTVKHAELNS